MICYKTNNDSAMLFSKSRQYWIWIASKDKQMPQMAPNQQESRLASALLWWHINFAVFGNKSAFGCQPFAVVNRSQVKSLTDS